MRTSYTGPDLCPECGAHLNVTTDPTGRRAPDPADLTLCLRCQAVLRFDGQMRVQALGPDELAELPAATRSHVERVQRLIREVLEEEEKARGAQVAW